MLYICATPIGNLEDITLRVLRILKEVDLICAEDTRHTLPLLNHYGIKKPLLSCHEHNETRRAAEITARLAAGENIAYVSDAGMPLVSDPGAVLVRECIAQGLDFTVLPGASAATAALVLSGLDSDEFRFVGFLPRFGAKRTEKLAMLKTLDCTAIIYESPNRVAATLRDMAVALGGDRECALVREITKLHEQTRRGTVSDLADEYEQNPPKGECVLLLAAASAAATDADDDAVRAEVRRLSALGLKPRDVAKEVARNLGIATNRAYEIVMEERNR